MRYTSECVDEYLDEVEPIHREAIVRLRALARRVLVGYVESMRLKMPTYEKDDRVFAFTRQRHNYSIYVNNAEFIERYKPRLGNASYGKNCIRYRDAGDIQWGVLDELLVNAYP